MGTPDSPVPLESQAPGGAMNGQHGVTCPRLDTNGREEGLKPLREDP